jgi:GR25 family glycosyltransferase involved in LPS biosynthesis
MNNCHIYVINLKKDVEKLANFNKQVNNEFTYTKITGIEPTSGNTFLNKGQLGCLRSHGKILEDAIKNNHKKILIFEDDVIFKDTWNNIQKKIERFQRAQPHLLYLGCSQHKWSNIRLKYITTKTVIKDIEIKKGFYHPLYSFGSFAFLMDQCIFKHLLEKYKKEEKAIDHYLLEYQASNRNKCIVMFPNKVIADVSTSTTGIARDMSTMIKIFKWDEA